VPWGEDDCQQPAGQGSRDHEDQTQCYRRKQGQDRRESEAREDGILVATIHKNIMQEIGYERAGEKRGGRAQDREESKRQSKILKLSLKLGVALGDEYTRLKSEDFPKLIHDRGSAIQRPYDDERVS